MYTVVALDFLIASHLDGQAQKTCVIIYFYSWFKLFFFEANMNTILQNTIMIKNMNKTNWTKLNRLFVSA